MWTMLLWLLVVSCKEKLNFHGQISKPHSAHTVDSIYNLAKGYNNLELVHKIADTLIQLGNVAHNPYALTKGYMCMSAYY